MATRKRTVSESGAYMSEYDQEVEKRLTALESQAHTPCTSGGADEERVAALEARIEQVVAALKKASPGAAKNL